MRRRGTAAVASLGLSMALATRFSVSAAKPTTSAGRCGPGLDKVARMSGLGTSSRLGGAAPAFFLILEPDGRAAFQSATYRYDSAPAADGGLAPTLIVNVQSSVSTVYPKVAIVPSTGDWGDLLSFASSSTLRVTPGDSAWFVVWEASGATGFSYTLSVAPAPRIIEEEPNDDPGQGRVMPVPGLVQPAELGSLTDIDWFKVSASAAKAGSRSLSASVCRMAATKSGSSGGIALPSR